MSVKKTQKMTAYLALLTEVSHVFCCVIPSIFSILTMMVGIGILGAVPFGIVRFHDLMHGWEMPIIITSGLILALGWVLHVISERLDCESSGCEHEPCAPKKKKTNKILKIATVLFVINVTIYTFVHVPHDEAISETHEHHDHDEHDH